ncbi:MAG: Polysaccharide transporter permease protein [Bryobacterales bacterium]|nr:Polysaccharide transporter permease protein [Bryobacterales bacterium]
MLNSTQGLASTVTLIEPSSGWLGLNLGEVWARRELLYFLTWREVKVRYKQTLLGASWALLQPLFTMVIFSLFFGRLAKMPSDGVPYPVFAFTALVPWIFFSNGLTQSSNSLINNSQLITKIYFPRLLVPTAAVLGGLIDFVLAFGLLLLMILWYGVGIHPNIIWTPLFVLLAFVSSLGAGLWLSALNVEYRDVRHTVPFLVQMWMFATPIAYPSSLLHEPWHTLYALNPMVGVVEGFRWAILGSKTRPDSLLLVSSAISITWLVTGALFFRRTEKRFADLI